MLRGAWGLADRDGGVSNRIDTRFGIASVGKTFTAVAVAQLAAAGRLRLDDPAARYAPDWLAPAARAVTIAQLLEHRSGLGDFLGVVAADRSRRYERLEDYRAIAAADTPAFTPGSEFRYSNTGYLVLGAVIEKVSGEPWDRYLEKHVFRPPGSPAGGSASTAEDLNAFGRALRAGTLIPRAELDSLLMPRVEMAGTGRMYARGFTVSREPRQRLWGHGGGFPGVSALLEVYEEDGWVLAVLSNTTEGAGIAGDAWRDLLSRGSSHP